MTRRCWCGRTVSWNGVECAEHDDAPAEIAAAMKRHPAGKALPARFDERYDPSPEPIDRSIQ